MTEARKLIDEVSTGVPDSLIEEYQVEDVMTAFDMAIEMVTALQQQLSSEANESQNQ